MCLYLIKILVGGAAVAAWEQSAFLESSFEALKDENVPVHVQQKDVEGLHEGEYHEEFAYWGDQMECRHQYNSGSHYKEREGYDSEDGECQEECKLIGLSRTCGATVFGEHFLYVEENAGDF